MKSYVQGLITGAVFVFALMVLMGAAGSRNQVGTYQAIFGGGGPGLLNTETGVLTGIDKNNQQFVNYDLVNRTVHRVKMEELEDK